MIIRIRGGGWVRLAGIMLYVMALLAFPSARDNNDLIALSIIFFDGAILWAIVENPRRGKKI